MRAVPGGTAGEMAVLANSPWSKSIFQNLKVFKFSPIIIGIMGVSVSPMSNPKALKSLCMRWVICQRGFLLCGSAMIMSKALETVATAEGGGEAEKINVLEKCLT